MADDRFQEVEATPATTESHEHGPNCSHSHDDADAHAHDHALQGLDADEDDAVQEYNDGDLPDFSDDEGVTASTSGSTPTSGGARRILPPPGSVKQVPGRKKMPPLAKLKAKLTPGGTLASTSTSAGQSPAAAKQAKKAQKEKDKKLAAERAANGEGGEDDDDALTSAKDPMSQEQLDQIMANLIGKTPGMENTTVLDVNTFARQMGINDKYFTGKAGLMGKGTKDMASHKFWNTQPVLKLGTPQDDIKEGPLEPNKAVEDIPKEPVELHKDFQWVTMDVNDPNQLKEVYDLLSAHYVEDPDATFRFAYEASFIEWALKPPGFVQDWHIGIRVAATGKLVGFIAGIPIDLRVRAVTKKFTEINFLCVHKKLRSKRLAPLLIREVTRRTHLKGIFQAIYTAGVYLPTPVTRCQYFHRNLNPRKLVETGFSAMPRGMTMPRMLKHFKLPEEPILPGLRELEKRDLKQVSRLLRAYLARMELAPLLSNRDVEHALLGGRGKDVGGKRVGQVTWSYVVEDPETHKITDMFSFYSLPSTAVKVKPPTLINAAYLFYYATTACPSCADLGDGSVATPIVAWKEETPEQREALKERLKVVVTDAMILAQKAGFDVLNCLTLQDNALFVEDLKFGKGDGFLHYYLYNYGTKAILGGIDANDGGSGVGVVML